jgi:hypothetical protein
MWWLMITADAPTKMMRTVRGLRANGKGGPRQP